MANYAMFTLWKLERVKVIWFMMITDGKLSAIARQAQQNAINSVFESVL